MGSQTKYPSIKIVKSPAGLAKDEKHPIPKLQAVEDCSHEVWGVLVDPQKVPAHHGRGHFKITR
jgi:hypothetical protein